MKKYQKVKHCCSSKHCFDHAAMTINCYKNINIASGCIWLHPTYQRFQNKYMVNWLEGSAVLYTSYIHFSIYVDDSDEISNANITIQPSDHYY